MTPLDSDHGLTARFLGWLRDLEAVSSAPCPDVYLLALGFAGHTGLDVDEAREWAEGAAYAAKGGR